VHLTVYEFLRQEIEKLIDAELPAGFHEIVWDGKTRLSGIYFHNLKVEAAISGNVFQQTRKMVLAR
jgi:hypothetical protein